jgi:enterochelin esterase-like enzyme
MRIFFMRISREERYIFTNQKGKPKILVWLYSLLLSLTFLGGSAYWYFIIAGAPPIDGPQRRSRDTKLSYQIETYESQTMGGLRTYGVSLPPDYSKNPQQHYPVIFLLHGGHGQPTDWFEKGAALPIIQKLYAEGKLPPSIIITPDGNDKRGSSPFYDSDYIDGPNGNVDTAIGEELVKEVQRRYRTLPAPAFWAIGGLSSGGWGAVNIGLHHPDHFSIMFSHSGFFCFPLKYCREKTYENQLDAQNSPVSYVKKLPPKDRAKFRIYLDAGKGDGEFLEFTRNFHDTLNKSKISNVFHEFPGGHVTVLIGPDATWNYWNKHLADSLSYVGKQFHEASALQAAPTSTYKKHRYKSRKYE